MFRLKQFIYWLLDLRAIHITPKDYIMPALLDLQNSVASLTTSVDALVAVVKAPPADAVSAADVETVVTQLNALKATVDAVLPPVEPAVGA